MEVLTGKISVEMIIQKFKFFEPYIFILSAFILNKNLIYVVTKCFNKTEESN